MISKKIKWQTEQELHGSVLAVYKNKKDRYETIENKVWWGSIYTGPLLRGHEIIGFKVSKPYVKWYFIPAMLVIGIAKTIKETLLLKRLAQ